MAQALITKNPIFCLIKLKDFLLEFHGLRFKKYIYNMIFRSIRYLQDLGLMFAIIILVKIAVNILLLQEHLSLKANINLTFLGLELIEL